MWYGAYSLDFILAGNLIIRSIFLSCSASSAKVCFLDDVDLVSEPTVCKGTFLPNCNLSLTISRLSRVLNE